MNRKIINTQVIDQFDTNQDSIENELLKVANEIEREVGRLNATIREIQTKNLTNEIVKNDPTIVKLVSALEDSVKQPEIVNSKENKKAAMIKKIREEISLTEMQEHMHNIANALSQNDINLVIKRLFFMNETLDRMKPIMGVGQRVGTDERFSHNIEEWVEIIKTAFPELQKTYDIGDLKSGTILQEVLGEAMMKFSEDKDLSSLITIPNQVLKLFASIANLNFTARNNIAIDFDTEVDPIVKKLDIRKLHINYRIRHAKQIFSRRLQKTKEADAANVADELLTSLKTDILSVEPKRRGLFGRRKRPQHMTQTLEIIKQTEKVLQRKGRTCNDTFFHAINNIAKVEIPKKPEPKSFFHRIANFFGVSFFKTSTPSNKQTSLQCDQKKAKGK